MERRKPVVTELALAYALDRLVVMIKELRTDVGLRVEVAIDDTQLLKLTFSGTPDVGFPCSGTSETFPARWSAASGTRTSATTRSSIAAATTPDGVRPRPQPPFQAVAQRPVGWIGCHSQDGCLPILRQHLICHNADDGN